MVGVDTERYACLGDSERTAALARRFDLLPGEVKEDAWQCMATYEVTHVQPMALHDVSRRSVLPAVYLRVDALLKSYENGEQGPIKVVSDDDLRDEILEDGPIKKSPSSHMLYRLSDDELKKSIDAGLYRNGRDFTDTLNATLVGATYIQETNLRERTNRFESGGESVVIRSVFESPTVEEVSADKTITTFNSTLSYALDDVADVLSKERESGAALSGEKDKEADDVITLDDEAELLAPGKNKIDILDILKQQGEKETAPRAARTPDWIAPDAKDEKPDENKDAQGDRVIHLDDELNPEELDERPVANPGAPLVRKEAKKDSEPSITKIAEKKVFDKPKAAPESEAEDDGPEL